jgi:hypothetical protein
MLRSALRDGRVGRKVSLKSQGLLEPRALAEVTLIGPHDSLTRQGLFTHPHYR